MHRITATPSSKAIETRLLKERPINTVEARLRVAKAKHAATHGLGRHDDGKVPGTNPSFCKMTDWCLAPFRHHRVMGLHVHLQPGMINQRFLKESQALLAMSSRSERAACSMSGRAIIAETTA